MSRPLPFFAALLVLAGGAIHLERWSAEYHDGTIGTMFLIQVILSAVLGIWLIVRPDRVAALAALALEVGTIAAFLWTRHHALFGFTSNEFGPWEKAALAVESGASVLLVISLALSARRVHTTRAVRRPVAA
jgi:hypothetical protein